MDYPQLYLPLEIVENFEKVFAAPVKPLNPSAPEPPVKGAGLLLFLAAVILALIFTFIKLPGIAAVIILGYIYSLFFDSPKEKYEEKMRKYRAEVSSFKRSSAEYEQAVNLNPQQYQSYKLNQSLDSILGSSSNHHQNTDYKKGVSHDYFKAYLNSRFSSSILESASIQNQKHPSYIQGNFNLYITDFAYIDKYTCLKIDIEIDEPYTFDKKQPIHLNDSARNNFFIENNWVVIRFAEEQVINYPEACCDYIQEIIHCFDCDFEGLKNLKTKVPNVKKWDAISIKSLIEADYRHSYLNGKIYYTL